jgi:hypothetical protein
VSFCPGNNDDCSDDNIRHFIPLICQKLFMLSSIKSPYVAGVVTCN